jgi:hypothetical protein
MPASPNCRGGFTPPSWAPLAFVRAGFGRPSWVFFPLYWPPSEVRILHPERFYGAGRSSNRH